MNRPSHKIEFNPFETNWFRDEIKKSKYLQLLIWCRLCMNSRCFASNKYEL